jgi:ribonuclease D
MSSHQHRRDDRRLSPRYTRRAISHEESHAGPGGQAPPPIAAHPLASPDAPKMVATNDGLKDAIARLRSAKAFAFDSEFIGELSYEPRLCLLQAATAREVFVIDPLCGLDVLPFWGLLADASVEKIVHSGQQDFMLMARQTGRAPANVLDAQIAAGFVHADYPLSLARLVEEFVGVPLGKAHTFTHWDHRPLSAVQVHYAGDDVRYLPAARVEIERRLVQRGRLAWAREECAATLEDASLYESDPRTLYLRVRGRDRMGRRSLAALRELAAFRDRAARRENVPPRSLLTDGVMRALARRPVERLADLARVAGLPRPVERQYGEEIVAATLKALAQPEADWPQADPPEPPALTKKIKALWDAIQRRCEETGVAAGLVASRREIVRLCLPGGEKSPGSSRLLRGWRREFLGNLLK